MSETNRICPSCGGPIPPEAPQGLCPKCVLSGAAETEPDPSGKTGHFLPPSVETLRNEFKELEILSLVGSGGMGAVYKARQPRLNRFVALKVLPKSLGADAGFAERFTREAQLLARLNHPGIVTIYDFGHTGSYYYLLMEYIDGVNLRQAMQAGRFSPAAALALVPQICDALQYAHGEGVLHRDIKPENILLDTRGRLKIADFGIAKLIGDKAVQRLTASGAVVGTPHYMAPEQFERPLEVDQRADVYSLGVVFYELLTGELPVGRFAAPSEKASVDPRVDPIVFRALEKERERRYSSAAEVKTSVEQVTGRPRPPSPPVTSPIQQPARRPVAGGATPSLIITASSLLPGFLVLLASWFLNVALRSGPWSPEGNVFSETRPFLPGLIPVLLSAILSSVLIVTGFAFGAIALRRIHQSGGELRGLKRALFGTLFWPVLILIIIASYVGAYLTGGFLIGGRAFLWRLALTTGLSLAAGVALVEAVRRWATPAGPGSNRTAALPAIAVVAALFFFPALLCAFVSGGAFGGRAAPLGMARSGFTRPTPILSGEYAPLPPSRFPDFGLGNRQPRSVGGLVLRFSVPAGQGATAELVTSSRQGIVPVPGLAGFILASPHQQAACVMVWGPDSSGDVNSDGTVGTWGIEAKAERQNAEARGLAVPETLPGAFGTGGSEVNMPTMEENSDQLHWVRERNGNIPGIGLRLRTFAHGLSGDEIAHTGFAGTGTNWVETIHAEHTR